MVTDEKIKSWRDKIDAIDFEILDLLEKRFELSKKLGIYKKQRGFYIEDKIREEDAIKARFGRNDMPEEFVRKLFALIFEHSKNAQN